MKSLASEQDRKGLEKRINDLQNVPKNFWHSMSGHQIVVHLADVIRVGLGEKNAKPAGLLRFIFSLPIIGWLTTQVIPWVPGIPAQPEFMERTGGTKLTNFEEDKQKLIDLMQRMGELKSGTLNKPDHPVFARLTITQWQRLMWKHIDHHLWQFEPGFIF